MAELRGTTARQDAVSFAEARMVRTTVNSIFDRMRGRFSRFPDDYLVFDVETTGFKLGEDLVAQLGYAKVRDRQVVETGWVFLDWTRDQRIDQDWLKGRVDSTRRHIESKPDGQPTGRSYKISYEKMASGMDPLEALRRYAKLFADNRAEGKFVVAHNGYHFDARFLEEHFSTFLDEKFEFGDHELFDTGVIEKGAQAGMTLWQGETVRDFSMRVSRTWLKGVYWALDPHCVRKYGLDVKMNIKAADLHDAVADCLLTHALFEEHRRQAEGTTQCQTLP